MVDLVFVPAQTSHGKGNDAEARRFVRATAMKAFRRRQRQELVKEHLQKQTKKEQPKSGGSKTTSDSESSPSPSPSPPKPESPFTSSTSLCQTEKDFAGSSFSPTVPFTGYAERIADGDFSAKAWSPHFVLLDGDMSQFDPLNLSAITDHPSRSFLFKHFCHVITPDLQPLGMNSNKNPLLTSWVRYALREPAMLEAALFHSSAHLDGLHNRPWTAATLYHRGEAMRLTNELLRSPDRALSDECIAAVNMLGATGNLTGDQTEAGVHDEAMKKMVDLRGGVGALGMDGSLEMMALIGDCIGSTMRLSMPMFKQEIDDEDLNTPLDFEAEIKVIFQRIARLSNIMDGISKSSNTTTAEILFFNKQRAAVEHRILSLDIPSISGTDDKTQENIYHACQIATLISTNYIFRDLSPALLVLPSLQRKLLDTLLHIEVTMETHHMTSSNAEMLMWICWIGGMLASDKRWYAMGVGRIMPCLALREWKDVEGCLRKFLWTERMRDRNHAALWIEVQKGWESGLDLGGGLMENMLVFDVDPSQLTTGDGVPLGL